MNRHFVVYTFAQPRRYPHTDPDTLSLIHPQINSGKTAKVSDQNQVSWNQQEQVMAAIAAKTKRLPPPSGDVPLLAGLELTDAQRQTMDRVHAAIAADFTLRRRMLLRRCDVTVQSFLRGKQGSSGEAVNPSPALNVRRLMVEYPRKFSSLVVYSTYFCPLYSKPLTAWSRARVRSRTS